MSSDSFPTFPQGHSKVVAVAIDVGASAIKKVVIHQSGAIEQIRGQGPSDVFLNVFHLDRATGQKFFDVSAAEQGFGKPEDTAARYKCHFGNPEKNLIRGTMSAEDVLTEVLKWVKSTGELQLGESLSGIPTIFTAPANYGQAQKQCILNAGTRAGFTPLRDGPDGGCILSEPGAALVGYVARNSIPQVGSKVLVQDLGHETDDNTVAEVADNGINALATEGINKLGGGYIADELAKLICGQAAKKAGLKSLDPAGMDPNDRYAFMQKVERVMISLSKLPTATIAVPVGRGNMQPVEVTVSQLEAILAPFANQIDECTARTLKKANLKPSDINYHVLVGGPYRLKYLRERAAKFIGSQPKTDVNPIMAIVEGAAIHAYSLLVRRGEIQTRLAPPSPKFRDVVPYSIGVALLHMPQNQMLSEVLFPTGMPVPARKQIAVPLVHPNQTEAFIQLVRCDRNGQPISECTVLADANLDGLPLESGAMTPRMIYEATFNAAGMIDLVVTDRISGKKVQVISTATGSPKAA